MPGIGCPDDNTYERLAEIGLGQDTFRYFPIRHRYGEADARLVQHSVAAARSSVYFSVIDSEWAAVKTRLERMLYGR